MINAVYRLKSPHRFEIAFEDITIKDKVIVRPTHLSICNADQRYFQGTRDAKVLKEKLPLALIHEAIGQVVLDPTNTFKANDRVIIVPNDAFEKDEFIAENYLRSSKFAGSTEDGFMKEYVEIEKERLIKIPDNIDLDVAAFTEFVSVSMHAISRFIKFSHDRRDKIGVWGDGNLGFITALLLSKRLKNSEIYVFGIDKNKLNDFSFATETYLTTEIPDDLQLDHAFECVGSNASQVAIEQIIKYIKPEGTISILGVSEYPVPINTRMILEKGLRIFGSSRSGVEDFKMTVDFYTEYPDVPKYLKRLANNIVEVNEFTDMKKGFDFDKDKSFGKTIMHWNL